MKRTRKIYQPTGFKRGESYWERNFRTMGARVERRPVAAKGDRDEVAIPLGAKKSQTVYAKGDKPEAAIPSVTKKPQTIYSKEDKVGVAMPSTAKKYQTVYATGDKAEIRLPSTFKKPQTVYTKGDKVELRLPSSKQRPYSEDDWEVEPYVMLDEEPFDRHEAMKDLYYRAVGSERDPSRYTIRDPYLVEIKSRQPKDLSKDIIEHLDYVKDNLREHVMKGENTSRPTLLYTLWNHPLIYMEDIFDDGDSDPNLKKQHDTWQTIINDLPYSEIKKVDYVAEQLAGEVSELAHARLYDSITPRHYKLFDPITHSVPVNEDLYHGATRYKIYKMFFKK